MDKTNSTNNEDVRWLKARVDHLEKSNRWRYAALETFAAMVDLHKDVKENADPASLFKIAGAKLGEMLDFQTLAFFQVDPSHSGFVLTDCFPEAHKSQMQSEIDHHVENGTFAWAIKQNRALAMDGKSSSGKLILHSISTQNRVLGLFAGMVLESSVIVGQSAPFRSAGITGAVYGIHARSSQKLSEHRAQPETVSIAANGFIGSASA